MTLSCGGYPTYAWPFLVLAMYVGMYLALSKYILTTYIFTTYLSTTYESSRYICTTDIYTFSESTMPLRRTFSLMIFKIDIRLLPYANTGYILLDLESFSYSLKCTCYLSFHNSFLKVILVVEVKYEIFFTVYVWFNYSSNITSTYLFTKCIQAINKT